MHWGAIDEGRRLQSEISRDPAVETVSVSMHAPRRGSCVGRGTYSLRLHSCLPGTHLPRAKVHLPRRPTSCQSSPSPNLVPFARHLPYSPPPRARRYTYLDTTGRPVLVLHRRNVASPEHSAKFSVEYSFAATSILREPLLLVREAERRGARGGRGGARDEGHGVCQSAHGTAQHGTLRVCDLVGSCEPCAQSR